MSTYDRRFPEHLDISLTDEDRKIWEKMSYPACNNYMQGHTTDAAVSQYMTIDNWVVHPMQPSMAARIRIESAERLGACDDKYAIY